MSLKSVDALASSCIVGKAGKTSNVSCAIVLPGYSSYRCSVSNLFIFKVN